jgi:pantoate kinase
LTKKTAKAFAPGAISSFFEIFNTQPNGTPITDLQYMGARGGGFGLQRGTHTQVTLKDASENSIQISINNQPTTEAKVTQTITQTLLSQVTKKYAVIVEHQIDVPVGMGFGTSAGGALTTALALKEALNLPLTYNQIGKLAHLVEIQLQTGLGTVSSLTFGGGLILVTQPGAPGICKIDRIPINPNYVVVVGCYKTLIPKKPVLTSPQRMQQINVYGQKALEAILAEPSLENFLAQCWMFSQNAGFATEGVCELVKVAKKAGAIGAAQNMIGAVVHAVVHEENASSVTEAFKQTLPSNQVIVSRIDFEGVRLIK